MDVIGRTPDSSAPPPPADPSPDLLNLDQVLQLLSSADPQGLYLEAAAFDSVRHGAQQLSDDFRKQAKGIDEAWHGSTADGHSSRMEEIAASIDQFAQGPDYAGLLRRAGDALAVGQKRLHDLTLQRDQQPGADPSSFDEQARQIFTDLAAAYEDIGQAIAGAADFAGAPAPPEVTLTPPAADNGITIGPTARFGRPGAAGWGPAEPAMAGGMVLPGGRVGPGMPGMAADGPQAPGGAPVFGPRAAFGAVVGRTEPPPAVDAGPPTFGAPGPARLGGPEWLMAAAVMPPSPAIGRSQDRSSADSDEKSAPAVPVTAARTELAGVPIESTATETTALPAQHPATEVGASQPGPPIEAPPAGQPAVAAAVVMPVPAAVQPALATGFTAATPVTAPSLSVLSAAAPAIPLTSSARVPTPLASGPGFDTAPGSPTPPPGVSATAALAAANEAAVVAPVPGGSATAAGEGAGGMVPMGGGGGAVMAGGLPPVGGQRVDRATGPLPEEPASWASEEYPFPVLGHPRKPRTPEPAPEPLPAALAARLPRLPWDIDNTEGDGRD